jgi:hypothetical protein
MSIDAARIDAIARDRVLDFSARARRVLRSARFREGHATLTDAN